MPAWACSFHFPRKYVKETIYLQKNEHIPRPEDIEDWLCYQSRTGDWKMQIVINYSISCTKLVVPLWRLTSNNFQYPLSFLYLHRFREKSPSLPPKKKTSSIWTSKQYVDRWFGSVRSKNIPPGKKNDVNDCLSDDFTTCLIRNPRLQTTRPCNAVRDLRPSCRRVLKERCYWQGCPWSFAETTSYAGLLRDRRRNMFVVFFDMLFFSQEQDRRHYFWCTYTKCASQLIWEICKYLRSYVLGGARFCPATIIWWGDFFMMSMPVCSKFIFAMALLRSAFARWQQFF